MKQILFSTFSKILPTALLGAWLLAPLINYATCLPEPPPILRAAERGNIEGVKKFLERGDDIEAKGEHGYTPLLCALASTDPASNQIIRLLLNRGANAGAKGLDGYDTIALVGATERIDLAPLILRRIIEQKIEQVAPLSPDISFIIADIKFSATGEVKILELGEGPYSYFKGHDAVYHAGAIWENLWQHLAKTYGVPMWLVDTELKPYQNDYLNLALPLFTKLGGTVVQSIHAIDQDKTFQQLNKQPTQKDGVASIIILRNHRATPGVVKSFHEKYPHSIIINEAARVFAANKFLTDVLLRDGGELAPYRPRCHIYHKQEEIKQLVHDIKKDFPETKRFVIKPLAAANGWGVIIIHRKELESTLRLILQDHTQLKSMMDPSFNQWLDDRNHHLIVEEFVPSKKIVLSGRPYEGTMRQIILLEHTSGNINVSFLGSYWKLPAKSLDQTGALTELYKSKVAGGGQSHVSSARVSPQDDAAVQAGLREILPVLYKKMLLVVS